MNTKRSKKKSSKKKPWNKIFYTGIIIIICAAIAGFFYVSSNGNETVHAGDADHGNSEYGKVTFFTSDGKKIVDLLVEVAEDEYEQATGLMFREDLSENQGMIFIHEDENLRYFWMKNTPLSLDMIFVDSNMKIVHIEKYTEPMSEELYPSKYPAQYVVETVAGFTDQYDIRVGSKISWNPPERN